MFLSAYESIQACQMMEELLGQVKARILEVYRLEFQVETWAQTNQALELHSSLPKSFKVCKERIMEKRKIEDSSYSLILHFWRTSRSPFSTCYIPFQILGSQKFNASNGARFGVEKKELQPLQEDHSKLKEDFCTTAKSAFCCENFAAILHSAQVFSWSFLIFATDSFRSFLQIFLYKFPLFSL